MELTQDVFAIHCDEICAKIKAFLHEKTTDLRRDGIVVPIYGGLDSSVVVSLCVRAAGKVQEIRELMQLTAHMRNPSLSPVL